MAEEKGKDEGAQRLVVWAEKYRPARLSEVINQTHATDRIRAFVADKNVPHMLFAGPAGVGKTTTALAIAYELYGSKWRENTLELNASNERGIDVIRNRVKEFARTQTLSPVSYRLIILDEADALTAEAQQALRRMMENYSNKSRFILVCNWSSRIIEPIQSRCAVFRFHTLGEEDQMKFLSRISKEEDLKIEDDAKDAIIYLAEGDLRKIANIVQACAAQKKKAAITEAAVFDVVSQAKPEDVKSMLDLAVAGNFSEARKKLSDMLLKQGLSGEDVIREMHKQVFNLNVSEQAKITLIEKTGEYEYRLSQGGTDMIQLESLLAQFALLCKK
jgi:replication factor C small subunit